MCFITFYYSATRNPILILQFFHELIMLCFFFRIMVYISGMKDDVEILSSLQKPKKITFIGTDGKHYPILCKPNVSED